ncbi:MAG: hypothetical protein HZA35_04130 [Parcubacteria group bacterium]|nr:hypothetical protein [Parcubacteria group bacterium]
MKRFLVVAREKDGRNAGLLMLIQVERRRTLEGLEGMFFEVDGKYVEIVEIIEVVRCVRERKFSMNPLLGLTFF